MKQLLLGAILGLLIAFPALLAMLLTVVTTVVSQPVVLVSIGIVLAWPRLTRTLRRWTA
ncbi:hypothetical protein [Streptomyces sp. NPDC055085]